ncbi:Os11g0668200, partial [Oryza sativa Japonica Group]
ITFFSTACLPAYRSGTMSFPPLADQTLPPPTAALFKFGALRLWFVCRSIIFIKVTTPWFYWFPNSCGRSNTLGFSTSLFFRS